MEMFTPVLASLTAAGAEQQRLGASGVEKHGRASYVASKDVKQDVKGQSNGQEHDLPLVRQGRRGGCPLLRRGFS
jgi:hypothetical protein